MAVKFNKNVHLPRKTPTSASTIVKFSGKCPTIGHPLKVERHPFSSGSAGLYVSQYIGHAYVLLFIGCHLFGFLKPLIQYFILSIGRR